MWLQKKEADLSLGNDTEEPWEIHQNLMRNDGFLILQVLFKISKFMGVERTGKRLKESSVGS